jgi:hypothetical protein
VRNNRASESRYVYVIAADGRIAYVAKPFKVGDQAALDELARAIAALKPAEPQ